MLSVRPAAAGKPPVTPRFTSDPSFAIWNMPTVPVPAFSEYRKRPSVLIVMSRFVDPAGFTATMVLPSCATGTHTTPVSAGTSVVAGGERSKARPMGGEGPS